MNDEQVWAAAVGLFGVGDVLTTRRGLQVAGVEEVHPLSQVVLDVAGPAGMVAVKVVVLAAFYGIYLRAPSEWRVGVPLGLALLGSLIVLNNMAVITDAQSSV